MRYVFFLISFGMCLDSGKQPAEYMIDVRRLSAPTEGWKHHTHVVARSHARTRERNYDSGESRRGTRDIVIRPRGRHSAE